MVAPRSAGGAAWSQRRGRRDSIRGWTVTWPNAWPTFRACGFRASSSVTLAVDRGSTSHSTGSGGSRSRGSDSRDFMVSVRIRGCLGSVVPAIPAAEVARGRRLAPSKLGVTEATGDQRLRNGPLSFPWSSRFSRATCSEWGKSGGSYPRDPLFGDPSDRNLGLVSIHELAAREPLCRGYPWHYNPRRAHRRWGSVACDDVASRCDAPTARPANGVRSAAPRAADTQTPHSRSSTWPLLLFGYDWCPNVDGLRDAWMRSDLAIQERDPKFRALESVMGWLRDVRLMRRRSDRREGALPNGDFVKSRGSSRRSSIHRSEDALRARERNACAPIGARGALA